MCNGLQSLPTGIHKTGLVPRFGNQGPCSITCFGAVKVHLRLIVLLLFFIHWSPGFNEASVGVCFRSYDGAANYRIEIISTLTLCCQVHYCSLFYKWWGKNQLTIHFSCSGPGKRTFKQSSLPALNRLSWRDFFRAVGEYNFFYCHDVSLLGQ